MWTNTPTYAFIIAFLSWVVVCLVRIWSFKAGPRLSGFLPSALFLLIKRSFCMAYAFIGLFLLDIMARVCFSGLISYGSFGNIAVPVVFCTALGTAYILFSHFISPTRTSLPPFAVMVCVYIYMSVAAPAPELHIALYTGLGLTLIFSIFDIIGTGLKCRYAAKNPKTETPENPILFSPPIWDLSRKINGSLGIPVYIPIWFLLSIEFVLQFEGYSLLCWI